VSPVVATRSVVDCCFFVAKCDSKLITGRILEGSFEMKKIHGKHCVVA
jgi:hypothetical protein